MRSLFLSFAVLIGGFLLAAPAQAYDIKNDFCGVHINFQYCKCAFHNQYCGSIGLDQDSANSHVYSEFNKWVAERESAACSAKGGEWNGSDCVIPSEEPEAQAEEPEEEVVDDVQEETPDEETKDEAIVLKECASPSQTLDVKKNECVYTQLYKKSQDGKECFFSGHEGISLDVEESIEFQEAIEGMAFGSGTVIETVDREGKPVKVGVIRKPNGDYVFTSDGEHYFDDLKSAARPGVWTRIKTGWGDFWNNVAGVFGIGVYVGRDTAGNPDAQREGQERYDAGKDAFKDLREATKDPEKQLADAQAVQSLWSGRGKQLFGEQYEDFLLSEAKNATGYDVKQIKQVLEGDYAGLATDQVGAIKDALYAAPAQAVVTLATELRDNDFANAAALYMREREAGKTPVQIMRQLESGELPELEYASTKGTGNEFADVMLMMGYEDAYQRYQLRQQLK